MRDISDGYEDNDNSWKNESRCNGDGSIDSNDGDSGDTDVTLLYSHSLPSLD